MANAVNGLMANMQARQNFLASALRSSQTLPVRSFAAGQELTFELNNAGILRYLVVSFAGSLTISGTGTAAPSKKGPWNALTQVQLNDYSGVTRINASPFMLHNLINLNKFGFDQSVSPIVQPYAAKVFDFPASLTVGTVPVVFNVLVPVMYDEDDPRGGLILTVPNGKCYLKVQCSNSLYGAGDDSLVVGAGYTVALTGNVTVTQYYFDPAAGPNGQIQLPMMDLSMIHEILESKSTDNLVAGLDKMTSLTTGRIYHIVMQQFFNGSAGLDTTDISRITFLYDGNKPTIDEHQQAYLDRIRRVYGRDLPPGIFVFDFRKKPWDSKIWGQLQTRLSMSGAATVNAGAYLATLSKMLYFPNTNLGGVPQ